MVAPLRETNTLPSDALPLDEVGALLIKGLRAREREIQRDVVAPFARDVERVYRVIERALGLDEGVIGTTHAIVGVDPVVVVRTSPADDSTAPGEASD